MEIGKPKQDRWSVETIIEKFHQIGVPHFQRGLVWNDQMVGKLLESLFFHTPCGTLLFWGPKEVEKEGIPLSDSRDKSDLELLIIDGQQRVRSLYEVFEIGGRKGVDEEGMHDDFQKEQFAESDEEETDSVEKTWCINLAHQKMFPDKLNASESLRHGSLFLNKRNPLELSSDQRRGNKYAYNLAPIEYFLDFNQGQPKEDLRDKVGSVIRPEEEQYGDEVLSRICSDEFIKNLQSMKQRKFDLYIFEEQENVYDLSDVVSIFNRINRSGMRVEKEEMAYASMISIRRDMMKNWLQKTFTQIHEKTDEDSELTLDRDIYLERTKEKNFGFKLFMRVLVQATSFHFNRAIGASNLSFGVLQNPDNLSQMGDEVKKEDFRKILDDTRESLLSFKKILNDELYCDDFRRLPDTRSLVPIFETLLRYPELRHNGDQSELGRKFIALFTLRLYFIDDSWNSSDIQDIADQIRDTNSLEEVVEISDQLEVHQEQINESLSQAQSLRHKYTLLYYWLIRKNGTRDFSYDNLRGDDNALKLLGEYGVENPPPEQEVQIREKWDPQKQHIIPRSFLKSLYDEDELRGSHEANEIGNLTYISRPLNHYEGGLGSQFIDLDLEGADNLKKHQLNHPDVMESYRVLASEQNHSEASNDQKLINAYQTFIETRRNQISEGFMDWIKELDEATNQQIDRIKKASSLDRIEPQMRSFQLSVEDKIRELDFDNDIEDMLIKINQSSLEGKRQPRNSDQPCDFVREIKFKGDGRRLNCCLVMKGNQGLIELDLSKDEESMKELNLGSFDWFDASQLNDSSRVELPVNGEDKSKTLEVLEKIYDYVKEDI